MLLKHGIVITTDSYLIEWNRLLETVTHRINEAMSLVTDKYFTPINIMDITLKSCCPGVNVHVSIQYKPKLGDMVVTVTNMNMKILEEIQHTVVKKTVTESPLSETISEDPDKLEQYGPDIGKTFEYKFNYKSNGLKRASVKRVLERVPKVLNEKLIRYQDQWS